MSTASVTILGSNSAVPAYNRFPTSQVLELGGENVLVDCGEGTQMQMQKFGIKRNRINHIFISHLHGDHYFGLVGVITSFGLMQRTADLHIYAPKDLELIIDLQCKAGGVVLPFQLIFHPITGEGLLLENNKIKVMAFPATHRIECYGFRFEEIKNPRKIDPVKCVAMEIPAAYYKRLQLGLDYETKTGEIIKNETVTLAASPAKSYAFCADTKYDETILPNITGVDLLYHETTYLKELQQRAAERFHSTTIEAATMALKADAKQLLIGHFSSKYKDIQPFADEAATIFPNVVLAIEGSSVVF